MLGDDDRFVWEFDDLMPGRFGVAVRRLMSQIGLAIRAVFGDVGDNDINAIRGKSQAKMAFVTRLPASFSFRFSRIARLAFELGSTEWIGRGRDGGIGRILVEPSLQLANDGLKFFNASQQLDAAWAIRIWDRVGLAHELRR
jgi:hypothetical protein